MLHLSSACPAETIGRVVGYGELELIELLQVITNSTGIIITSAGSLDYRILQNWLTDLTTLKC